MEVHLNPELQAKLSCLAMEPGRDSESLVVEAVERLVNYQEWFLPELEKGLLAADQGNSAQNVDIKKLTEGRYPG
jgi:predicted transcriptional regulator